MAQNTAHHQQVQITHLRRAVQVQIVTFACAGVGLALIAIIGGWAITGTLEDWETVVGGVIMIGLLAGLAILAKRGHPSLSALLLSGLLFVLIAGDSAYYGLGSPSIAALLLPVLLIACTFGRKPGLAAAAIASAVVFGIAWASLNGMLETAAPVVVSHLSFTAPVISVILFFSAGLVGTAVDVYQQMANPARQPNGS